MTPKKITLEFDEFTKKKQKKHNLENDKLQNKIIH